MSIRDIYNRARRFAASGYQFDRNAPNGLTADAAILIQHSPQDGEWIAALVRAPRPVKLGRVSASAASPSRALSSLSDVLELIDDTRADLASGPRGRDA